MAYATQTYRQSQLILLDRAGRQVRFIGTPSTWGIPETYGVFRVSPDENEIVINRLDQTSGTPDLWILDLARNTMSRFTVNSTNDNNGVWSPDGEKVVFDSDRDGMYNLYEKAYLTPNTLPFPECSKQECTARPGQQRLPVECGLSIFITAHYIFPSKRGAAGQA